MRDLASRLRAIVAANPPEATRHVVSLEIPEADVSSREAAAAALGGTIAGLDESSYIVVDRLWDLYRSHGRRRIDDYAIDPGAPLALFDPRLVSVGDWASRVVFFDIETTGLSGGAGMIAFLAGCGWFEDDGFHVRQFFLAGPGGESAMLDALADVFDRASLVVTFNGRSFDLPVMDMRWAFHRKESPTSDVPHFDMLPPARRLWGRRDAAGCSLSSLESSILGFHRVADVPGLEIPSRYFQFLRTGDASRVEGVLEHNRHDIVSLAAITAHALGLGKDGPEACREAGEQIALGRLYERAGDGARATRAYELAAASHDRQVRRDALTRLAILFRRDANFVDAAAAWQGVLDADTFDGRELDPTERRAAEALAIHHEHRARDLAAAKRYAELLRHGADEAGVSHRLGRIERKLAENAKGGQSAAPLFKN